MPRRFYRALAGAPVLFAIGACTPTEQAQLSRQLTTWSSNGSARATSNRIYYNQGSSVTQAQVDRLRHYTKDQPTSGMRKLLGSPAWIDDNGETEVYPIANADRTPITAGNRLIVRYRRSAACNYNCYEAFDWRVQ
jgi:outer membrane protein assembly factor BamE (lipoprotein component of BamABCDE complex)